MFDVPRCLLGERAVVRILLLTTLLAIFGCASGERVVQAPVVLPDDPANVVYSDLQPKLRNLAWQATEAYYRDDWKTLSDTATTIERAAKLLKSAKSPPVKIEPILAPTCEKLSEEALKLREAADRAATDQVSQHLQQVHNLIRTLRNEA